MNYHIIFIESKNRRFDAKLCVSLSYLSSRMWKITSSINKHFFAFSDFYRFLLCLEALIVLISVEKPFVAIIAK